MRLVTTRAPVRVICHPVAPIRAASTGKGKMYGDVYSVSPAGVFVPPDSPVKTPEDLAGVPISVGFQSGSHYSTVQALEQYLPADKINLSFQVEERFSITIPDDALDSLRTVGDIVAGVERLLAEKS